MRWMTLIPILLLAACAAPAPTPPSRPAPAPQQAPQPAPTSAVSVQAALSRFAQVVRAVEPVAEAECRRRTQGVPCDFEIVVDRNETRVVNAFQTLDRRGQPVLIFTQAFLTTARNADELAFVMGHEAAHHIRGHIPRKMEDATIGALLLSGLATLGGADAGTVESMQRLGAQVGARSFSKTYELEADRLGTVIAAQAGFDPVRGSAFFTRIPDPGDRFLGTHPPNADRIRTVRETAARL